MKKGLFFALILALTACSEGEEPQQQEEIISNEGFSGDDHIYAQIFTSKGEVMIDLAFQEAPKTVANFIMLSEGAMATEYSKKGRCFYSGLKFHRVVPGYMVQSGDPVGNGTGGPGYAIADEITELSHNRAGTVSMANAGPNTGGSQFFITLVSEPQYDGVYTVFGYVVNGQKVIDQIEKGDFIDEIKIVREGNLAISFDETEHMKGVRR